MRSGGFRLGPARGVDSLGRTAIGLAQSVKRLRTSKIELRAMIYHATNASDLKLTLRAWPVLAAATRAAVAQADYSSRNLMSDEMRSSSENGSRKSLHEAELTQLIFSRPGSRWLLPDSPSMSPSLVCLWCHVPAWSAPLVAS